MLPFITQIDRDAIIRQKHAIFSAKNHAIFTFELFGTMLCVLIKIIAMAQVLVHLILKKI
jgi:hypothetical protein